MVEHELLFMASILDKITLFPAIILFALSVYLAFLTLQVIDVNTKRNFLIYATILFVIGMLLIVTWIVSSIIQKSNKND